MKKYLLIGLALTALLSTSCADDMPDEPVKSRSVSIKLVEGDTIVTDTLVFKPDTKMDFLREFYKRAWAWFLEDKELDRGGFSYTEDPDYEDMIAFLTWATNEYESLHEYSEFDEVAELLGYTKVWHEEYNGYWEIYKN